MRVGVLFNAGAGGAASFPEIGEALLSRFDDDDLVTCEYSLGGAWLAGVPALPVPELPFIRRVRTAVGLLVDSGAELLVCAGGDGFAAYCAEALILSGAAIPLLGVAGGTANVGPLLRFDARTLAVLPRGELRVCSVHALECACGGAGFAGAAGFAGGPAGGTSFAGGAGFAGGSGFATLGLAFNDIVIGDTFLGTLDGAMVNLCVSDFLKDGHKTKKRPSERIAGPDFRVRHNGNPLAFRATPVQIVAAPLNDVDFYRGKASAGALCAAPWRGSVGVIALCDRVWVSMDEAAPGFSATEQLLVGPGDIIELDGLRDEGQVIVDGNPFLREGPVVRIACLPGALRVVQA
jgi:hypothetical protein